MTCKTWSLLAEKYFNPLCTNRFYSPESCPICVSPFQNATVTPCSKVILPKETKTYMLLIKTPVSVSFAYPGLSPWKDDMTNPRGGSFVQFASGWPATIITFDTTNGYEFFWNHGASGNIWGATLITNVDPFAVKKAIIQPGTETVSGDNVKCGFGISVSKIILQTEVPRVTTINPPVDSYTHPQIWNIRNFELVKCRLIYSLEYWAETPDVIGGPDWDDPVTTYNVSVAAHLEQTSSLQNGVKLGYANRSGTSPWSYGIENTGVSVDGFVNRVQGSSPGAVTFATYKYSTTNRAAFLAATSFTLTKQAVSAGYTSLSTPNSASTITGIGGYVMSVVQRGGSFPGWSTLAPSSSGINTQFSDGSEMATGWPASIVVQRKEV